MKDKNEDNWIENILAEYATRRCLIWFVFTNWSGNNWNLHDCILAYFSRLGINFITLNK